MRFSWLNSTLDDISLWKKSVAIVSIPLLLLCATIVLIAWYEKEARDAQARVSHSLEVKASLYQILTLVTDSETGTRGFLLWKKPIYLNPYNESKGKLTDALDLLADLVNDNTDQAHRAQRLRDQAQTKMDTLKQMLASPEAAASAESPLTVKGRDSMKNFRTILSEMEATERTLLNARIHDHESVLEQINRLLFILFIFGIIAGFAATYIVWSGIVTRINELERYARQVSRSQPGQWEGEGEDELGQLGRSVKIMTHNLLSRKEALENTQEQLKKANQRLESLLLETRATNQELEAFSYSVSHDLRAPLRHVAGFSELMLRNSDSLDAKNRRYLDIISTSVQQMGVLIDELLAFSRMGRTAIKSDPVNLNEVINDVLSDLSPEIINRNIDWNIDQLPTVKGDRTMIHLVFQNLVSNALKYSRKRDPARIEIKAALMSDSDMYSITFIDNGVGFDMSYADKLFGVFQRLHSSDDYEGTGIGLATVRRIVQRHGGSVSAEGHVEQGAKFTVALPAYKDERNDETT